MTKNTTRLILNAISSLNRIPAPDESNEKSLAAEMKRDTCARFHKGDDSYQHPDNDGRVR